MPPSSEMPSAQLARAAWPSFRSWLLRVMDQHSGETATRVLKGVDDEAAEALAVAIGEGAASIVRVHDEARRDKTADLTKEVNREGYLRD